MSTRRLHKGEKIIRVCTPLGASMGEFIATVKDLPLLVQVNKSNEGCVYFRWSGIKREECG